MKISVPRLFVKLVLLLAMAVATQAISTPNLVSVKSRKVHTGLGPVDIQIDIGQPVGGAISIEPREIGGGHDIVARFDSPISSVSSIAINDPAGASLGVVATPIFLGQEVVFGVSALPSVSRALVAINGVNGLGDVSFAMGYLPGDVDSNGIVDAFDVSAVKAQSAQPASGSTGRYDLNASGFVNAADISIVKTRMGIQLPPVGQVALLISMTGTGNGGVASSPAGITCPSSCTSNLIVNSLVTLSATPQIGSTFVGWSGDCTGMAPTIMVTVSKGTHCSAQFAINYFNVSPVAGANGILSPSSPTSIAFGQRATFLATPDAGYSVVFGGTCGGVVGGNIYTTNPISASCTVTATFQQPQITISVASGPGGTVSPTGQFQIASGGSAVVTITPSAGYSTVIPVGGSCMGTLVGTTYTLAPTSAPCSILPNFVPAGAKYVSTTGNDLTGDGSSTKPYKTISKGIASLVSGGTLVVRRGTYSGFTNFIRNVPSGTASQMTTIMAESPMDVRIQSTTALGYDDKMLSVNNNYVKVDGFIFDMVATLYPPNLSEVNGNFNKITRSIFRRSGNIDTYGGLMIVGGSDNLFEELAGTGACRYCFSQGGPTAVAQRNIWRRVVGRFDYSNSNQPKATFSTYGNDSLATNKVFDHLYQNVIAIDGQRPGNAGGDEKYGAFYAIKAATNVRYQGCLVLNDAVTYSGMHLRDYSTGTTNFATNSVIWDLAAGSTSFAIGIKGNVADHMTIGGIVPGAAFDLTNGAPATSLLKPAAKPSNILNNTPGAVVLKQYGLPGTRWGEPGYDQLTNIDLWPWPYEDRIKSVFREPNASPVGNTPTVNNTLRGFSADGNGLYGGPITLTSYIWEYLGTPCPANICR